MGTQERVAKHEVVLEHMEDMFDMLDQDRDKKISVQHLPELVHLMSEDIGKHELIYLAKECCRDGKWITKERFLRAMDRIAEDVSLDPYETCLYVLNKLIFKNQDVV